MKLAATIAIAALLALPAMADQPPAAAAKPIEWNHTFTDENGAPFPPDHCDVPAVQATPATPTSAAVPAKAAEGCHPLTLALLVSRALYRGDPDEKLSWELSWPRGALAEKIRTTPEEVATLNTEQAPVVKHIMGKIYPAIIIAQAYPLLFPKDEIPPIK